LAKPGVCARRAARVQGQRQGARSVLARKTGLSQIRDVKTYRFVLPAIVLFSLALAGFARAEESWQTDYKGAQEQAKAAHKLLLVDFTGSDWCAWCKRLNAEVFSKSEFQEYAKKNLVLLEVDFPRRKQQPDSLKKQNEQLAMQYQIEGFPTIIVLNSEGKKVGELGYIPGGANAFIAQIEKLKKG
jgi:thioredoxin-related protein